MKISVIKRSPVLSSETRTGKDKFWAFEIVKIGSEYFTQAEHWQAGNDKESKHTFSTPYLVKGKNLGKKNETSDLEQAEFDFNSTVKKYRDKGYGEGGKRSDILPQPMLAQKYKERKHKIDWKTAKVQPKLDGSRMLYDASKAWSRGGKLLIPEVIQHLQFDTKGHIIDGELMLPGNVKLQETMKATKKYRKGVSDELMYMVYDVVEPSMVFSERYALLAEIINSQDLSDKIILVETFSVENEGDVTAAQIQFTKDGYEGTMIRDDSCGYDIGHRSNSLQKMKDFKDEEFKILNVIEGEGSDKGCAIFICKGNKNDEEFRARLEGTKENSKEVFKDRKNLIGKFVNVRFQGITNKKVPYFGVATYVREEGDF